MKPHAAKNKLTIDDYMDLDDGRRYELLDGELEEMTPAPTPYHQGVSGNLFLAFGPLKKSGKFVVLAAPVDVVLEEHNVVQPDIVLIRSERASIVGEKNIRGAPDVLVEILSPSTRKKDRSRKKKLYARHEVPFHWIVDLDAACIERYRLEGTAYALIEKTSKPGVIRAGELDGLEVALDQIFV